MGKTRIHLYKDKLMTLSELMPFCVVEKKTLKARLKRGWEVEAALTKPLGEFQGVGTKRAVNSEINKHNKKTKKFKIFAQCTRRCNAK